MYEFGELEVDEYYICGDSEDVGKDEDDDDGAAEEGCGVVWSVEGDGRVEALHTLDGLHELLAQVVLVVPVLWKKK